MAPRFVIRRLSRYEAARLRYGNVTPREWHLGSIKETTRYGNVERYTMGVTKCLFSMNERGEHLKYERIMNLLSINI